MDVDGFPAISVKFRMASRETWLFFEMRNVDGWKSSDPCSIPAKGELFGY